MNHSTNPRLSVESRGLRVESRGLSVEGRGLSVEGLGFWVLGSRGWVLERKSCSGRPFEARAKDTEPPAFRGCRRIQISAALGCGVGVRKLWLSHSRPALQTGWECGQGRHEFCGSKLPSRQPTDCNIYMECERFRLLMEVQDSEEICSVVQPLTVRGSDHSQKRSAALDPIKDVTRFAEMDRSAIGQSRSLVGYGLCGPAEFLESL